MQTDTSDKVPKRRPAFLTILACAIALAGCGTNAPEEGAGNQPGDGPSDAASPTPSPTSTEAVSILRADIEQPESPAPPLEPLNATIGLPDGGDELDEDALAALRDILASEQIALGGPIILRAHSDSAGSDRVNADAAEARGIAVAGWLIEHGVAEDRIDVIVFGEQNPIAPNALPDGTPNEAGRALNRRVEVLIVPPKDGAKGSGASTESGN